eukprot:7267111-Pyramimonas_sp.AAC.1
MLWPPSACHCAVWIGPARSQLQPQGLRQGMNLGAPFSPEEQKHKGVTQCNETSASCTHEYCKGSFVGVN